MLILGLSTLALILFWILLPESDVLTLSPTSLAIPVNLSLSPSQSIGELNVINIIVTTKNINNKNKSKNK